MAKEAIQTVSISFKVSPELKSQCEEALRAESKGLSEFLRDAMFQKFREYQTRSK